MSETPGGKAGDAPDDGPELRRSDLNTLARALRADWPIPDSIRRTLLQQVIDLVDPETERGAKASPRLKLSALKVLQQFNSLSLRQQAVDLAREQLELRKGTGKAETLADLVAEAEAAAESYQPEERP